MKVTTKTDIKEFPLLNRGKVRDIYDIDDSTLLIVTTDRMSAFDVIMNRSRTKASSSTRSPCSG